jgi:osmotically inducible protein OsmC
LNDAPPRPGRRSHLTSPAPSGRNTADEKESLHMIKRSASAMWKGGLKDGSGHVSTEAGALNNVPYNFSMRFENQKGTNPEELIAAAHAACFSMFLSMVLADAGMTGEINTTATVTLEQVGSGFDVTSSALETTVKVPQGDQAKFQAAAEAAKTGCPISKLLNTKITMNAKLV